MNPSKIVKKHQNRFVGVRLVQYGTSGYTLEVFSVKTGKTASFTIHSYEDDVNYEYRLRAQFLQAHPEMRDTSDMIGWGTWQIEQQTIAKEQWDADRERFLEEMRGV